MNDPANDQYYNHNYCHKAFYFSKKDDQHYSSYLNNYEGTYSVSENELCLYYLIPSKNDGYDAVKIELKAQDISNAYFESKAYIYQSKTGEFKEQGNFYTGDKLTIDINLLDGEAIAIIANTIQDSNPFQFTYKHKGKAGTRFPWWGILLITLGGLCVLICVCGVCLVSGVSLFIRFQNKQTKLHLDKLRK